MLTEYKYGTYIRSELIERIEFLEAENQRLRKSLYCISLSTFDENEGEDILDGYWKTKEIAKAALDTQKKLYAETLIETKRNYREIIDWILEELQVPVTDRDSLIQEAIAATTREMP